MAITQRANYASFTASTAEQREALSAVACGVCSAFFVPASFSWVDRGGWNRPTQVEAYECCGKPTVVSSAQAINYWPTVFREGGAAWI